MNANQIEINNNAHQMCACMCVSLHRLHVYSCKHWFSSVQQIIDIEQLCHRNNISSAFNEIL